MQIEYKRDLNHNYVVLESDAPVETDSYQVRMILANDITGFLACSISQLDGRVMFGYEITSRQSLAASMEQREVVGARVIEIMNQVLDAIVHLQTFLLDADNLVLKPEVIYEPNGGGNLSFCYLPGYQQPIRQGLRGLIEYLLPKIDHTDKEAVAAGYGIYRKIMEENWGIDELRATLFEQNTLRPEKNRSRRLSGEYTNNGSFRDDSNRNKDYRQDDYTNCSRKTGGYVEDDEEEEPQDIIRGKLLDQFFTEEEEQEPKWKAIVGIAAVVILAICFVLLRVLQVSVGVCVLIVSGICVAGAAGAGLFILLKKKGTVWHKHGFLGKIKNLMGLKPGARSAESEGDMNFFWEEEDEYADGPADKSADGYIDKSADGYIDKPADGYIDKPADGYADERAAGYTGRHAAGNIRRSVGRRNPAGRERSERSRPSSKDGETELIYRPEAESGARLVAVDPPTLQTIFLEKELTLIGTLPQAVTAVIPMKSISRIHAKIKRVDGTYRVGDLSSKNGTLINSHMLIGEEERILEEGDEVQFAGATYRFFTK